MSKQKQSSREKLFLDVVLEEKLRINETRVVNFLKKYPTFNGEGVTVTFQCVKTDLSNQPTRRCLRRYQLLAYFGGHKPH